LEINRHADNSVAVFVITKLVTADPPFAVPENILWPEKFLVDC
jgi:hypothetical protein